VINIVIKTEIPNQYQLAKKIKMNFRRVNESSVSMRMLLGSDVMMLTEIKD
jgi:hypothetical protein